jgi:SAM-dependent methyltransferase
MSSRYADHLPSIIAALSARYGVGASYIEAYLRRFDDEYALPNDMSVQSLDDLMRLPPPFPMWIDYAMSTNQRGSQIAALLLPHAPNDARRYLDIGCGFGGCLIAFARAGLDVTGFEIDPERAALARANCHDFGILGAVEDGDLLDTAFVARAGKFDLITLIDVIEHVRDVPLALRHTRALLNRGGVMLLEIPNPHSIAAVANDGHFDLFGITLLDPPDAAAYHAQRFAFAYDVGSYYPLDYYRRAFADAGCTVELLASPLHEPRSTGTLPRLLGHLHAAWEQHNAQAPLPPTLRWALQTRFTAYLSQLIRDHTDLHAGQMPPQTFVERYLLDFWTLLVRA